jgi:tetratricopeptide (TPR) repeat protein
LNRSLFPAILALSAATCTASAATTPPGQLDASETLFTVMAAINAAGYSADLSSTNNHPLRDAIRGELAKRNIPSLPAIREFFDKHRKKNDTLELGQYVSFALTAGPPPSFAIKQRDVDIPIDVTPLVGLSPLLAAFYKEADIEDLWMRSRPAIDQYLERYHEPVSEAVLQVNAYLRQQTSGFKGRHFQIFVELLAAPNEVQTRSYGDEYTIVVTPSPDPRIFDVRHAYLHYLLDPLSTRFQEILNRKKPIADQAARAPALDESFKDDFLLLVTESMIKAVEARLDRKPERVQEALRQGYILAPFFSEHLPVYEKQEQAMLLYYPLLVGAIDLPTEEARLSQVVFDKSAPVRTVKYLAVLQQTDSPVLHAAAYYGTARIAALQKDPQLAERLFKKTLELQPEPQVKAWTLVYLGRLSMAAGDHEQAAQYFQSALKVEGASAAAQQAASQGVETSSK